MTCDKHRKTPVEGYCECAGCEIENLRADVEKWKALAESYRKLAEIQEKRKERSERLGIPAL